MAIYVGMFGKTEKIQSAKLRNMLNAINNHVHNGINGIGVSWSDITGTALVFSASSFADASITYDKIADKAITLTQIDRTTVYLSTSGYALYS
jgi:hypothetical protein